MWGGESRWHRPGNRTESHKPRKLPETGEGVALGCGPIGVVFKAPFGCYVKWTSGSGEAVETGDSSSSRYEMMPVFRGKTHSYSKELM